MGKLAVFLLFLCVAAFAAEDKPDFEDIRAQNLAEVKKTYRDNLKRYRKNRDMLVLPGLLANRREKWVRIHAEATALGSNEPVEFLLIAEYSGHDYESIAVSLARPSHIHQALVFIGIKPGAPANQNKLRLWPKGERVLVTLEWKDAAGKKPRRVKAESLMIDKRTHKPFPVDGFIFAGSVWKDSPGEPGKKIYAADTFGPNSIVSHYNDRETVLDVPRQANKDVVYEFQYPNPKFNFTKGQLMDVIMEPEYKDGKQQVTDLNLRVSAKAGKPAAASMDDLAFAIKSGEGKRLNKGTQLKDILAVFEKLVADGRDPYVTIDFDGSLPLSVVREFCAFLIGIDSENGIRIEPPLPGHLYYKAFVPDEKLRESTQSIVFPWEFRLASTNGTVTGTLLLKDEIRDEADGKWKTRVREFDGSTPEAVRKALDTKDKFGRRAGLSVVFVFAPGTMSYKALTSLAGHMVKTHPTVFVFLE